MRLNRERVAVLPLVLKAKWYDMIASGDKREEYRTSQNVISRIERWVGRGVIEKKLLVVEFFLGYQKNRPHMAFTADIPVIRNDPAERAQDVLHFDWGEPCLRHYAIPLIEQVELYVPDRYSNV